MAGRKSLINEELSGAPLLSPYHTEQIWNDVYRHHDPEFLSRGEDLRPELGRQLHGGDVWWPDRNPSPSQYRYTKQKNVPEMYREYLNNILKGSEESFISTNT